MTAFVFRDFCPESTAFLDFQASSSAASVTFRFSLPFGPFSFCGRAEGVS
jgi:hypothetical protein